jgi:hypothetical protein
MCVCRAAADADAKRRGAAARATAAQTRCDASPAAVAPKERLERHPKLKPCSCHAYAPVRRGQHHAAHARAPLLLPRPSPAPPAQAGGAPAAPCLAPGGSLSGAAGRVAAGWVARPVSPHSRAKFELKMPRGPLQGHLQTTIHEHTPRLRSYLAPLHGRSRAHGGAKARVHLQVHGRQLPLVPLVWSPGGPVSRVSARAVPPGTTPAATTALHLRRPWHYTCGDHNTTPAATTDYCTPAATTALHLRRRRRYACGDHNTTPAATTDYTCGDHSTTVHLRRPWHYTCGDHSTTVHLRRPQHYCTPAVTTALPPPSAGFARRPRPPAAPTPVCPSTGWCASRGGAGGA